MGINHPNIDGQVPFAVKTTIDILRYEIERTQAMVSAQDARIAAARGITLDDAAEGLAPTGEKPLPTAGLLNTQEPETEQPKAPVDDGIANYVDIVSDVKTELNIGPTTTPADMFASIREIVTRINAEPNLPDNIICGLVLAPPAGENVYTCAGTTYRYNRVGFSNGHLFKVYSDSDPGGQRLAAWDDNGLVPSLYAPAVVGPC